VSPVRTLATARRVLAQIRHDPRTIALLLVVPSLLIGLVAWLFSDTPAFQQIGPAMLALFPFIIMFLVTSIATLRERRSGTLERLLSLPLSKLDFILGYTLAFGLLAILQAAIAVAFAVGVCGLEIDGPLWLLLGVALADAVLGTTLGLLASAFARTEFQVVQFMPAIVFPQVLLGGVLLPRDQMPDVLYAISDWLPLSHAIDALNAVATDSEDAGYVAGQLLILAAFSVGAVALGSITLRRRTA
jgi:ABC-2 type transport system ATP-binding protein/ABC-2 type transport system permease protein